MSFGLMTKSQKSPAGSPTSSDPHRVLRTHSKDTGIQNLTCLGPQRATLLANTDCPDANMDCPDANMDCPDPNGKVERRGCC